MAERTLLLLVFLLPAAGCSSSTSGDDPADTTAAPEVTAVEPGERQGPSLKTPVDVSLVKKKLMPAPRGDDDLLKDISTRKQGIDWPTFLGASRTNTSPEKGIITD